jgi:hypothetical protein
VLKQTVHGCFVIKGDGIKIKWLSGKLDLICIVCKKLYQGKACLCLIQENGRDISSNRKGYKLNSFFLYKNNERLGLKDLFNGIQKAGKVQASAASYWYRSFPYLQLTANNLQLAACN